MSKFYSSDYIIKVLRRKGFDFISQKGSHIKFQKINPPLTVIIPAGRKEIPIGTFRSILRQSKLKDEDFK